MGTKENRLSLWVVKSDDGIEWKIENTKVINWIFDWNQTLKIFIRII